MKMLTIILAILESIPQNPLFIVLLAAIGLDVFTGFSKAVVLKKLSSSIGLGGLMKHANVLILNVVVYTILTMMNLTVGIPFVLGFYIFTYAVSITENYLECGFPFPKSAKDLFIKLRDFTDDSIGNLANKNKGDKK